MQLRLASISKHPSCLSPKCWLNWCEPLPRFSLLAVRFPPQCLMALGRLALLHLYFFFNEVCLFKSFANFKPEFLFVVIILEM